MNLNDILTLAKAGYSAEQINQFAQPMQMQAPQPMQMQAPQPQVQAPQPMQMQAPQPQVQAPQPMQMQAPQPMQMQAPQPMQMQTPQPMQTAQRVPDVPLTFDIKKTDPNEAMKQMASALASAQQANLALLSGQNPTLSQVQTADDVTSQIIKEGI